MKNFRNCYDHHHENRFFTSDIRFSMRCVNDLCFQEPSPRKPHQLTKRIQQIFTDLDEYYIDRERREEVITQYLHSVVYFIGHHSERIPRCKEKIHLLFTSFPLRMCRPNYICWDPKEGSTLLHTLGRQGWDQKLDETLTLFQVGDTPELFQQRIDQKDRLGFTPLNTAAADGHRQAVEKLVQFGADVTSANGEGFSPLHSAAEKGHLEVAELLLAHAEIEIDAQDARGRTPLIRAIKEGHTSVAQLLLEKGASPTLACDWGFTPLHWATQAGEVAMIEELASRSKSGIDSQDGYGYTALALAARDGRHGAVESLLKWGADPALATDAKDMPLHLACSNAQLPVVKIILEAYPLALHLKNSSGESPLSAAVRAGSRETALFLLEQGADINNQTRIGFTPLMSAIASGQQEITRTLLNRQTPRWSSIDLELENDAGCTALIIAASKGDETTYKHLVEAGAKPCSTDRVDLLLAAVKGGSTQVVEDLIERGMQPTRHHLIWVRDRHSSMGRLLRDKIRKQKEANNQKRTTAKTDKAALKRQR